MKIRLVWFILIFSFLVFACNDENVDDQTPEIDLSIEGAFPVNCDTLYFGETHTIRLLLQDNVELGSITALSIDIHNNFDHHSHSTEVTECNLDEEKNAVNPYVIIQSFDLPEGQSTYETSFELALPESNAGGDFDEGDYHFFISLADKEGWSVQKGLSIKILHR